MEATNTRRRWSFSLRAIFVVVTLVSCWLGWELNWIRQRHEFLKSDRATEIRWTVYRTKAATIPTAPAGLWLLGEHGHQAIAVFKLADCLKAERLFPEASIHYCGP